MHALVALVTLVALVELVAQVALVAPNRTVWQDHQLLLWAGSHKDVPNLAPKKSQFGYCAVPVAFDTTYISHIHVRNVHV